MPWAQAFFFWFLSSARADLSKIHSQFTAKTQIQHGFNSFTSWRSKIISSLLVSYGIVLFSLRAHSSESLCKALSTCQGHITIVFFIFVPCINILIQPTSTLSSEKYMSMFVNVLTQLYSFSNKEMKNGIRKIWKNLLAVSDNYITLSVLKRLINGCE